MLVGLLCDESISSYSLAFRFLRN